MKRVLKRRYVFITHQQLVILRRRQWRLQKKICPILNTKINFSDGVLDHKHKLRKEKIGEDGKGLIRGLIHTHANILEGKVYNTYKRYHLEQYGTLPEILRRLADYLESPLMEQKYVHPSERPKRKKFGKREYNKLAKNFFDIYPNKRTVPEYPKSGLLTKKFKVMISDLETYLKGE